jgi:hypothetical protein
MDPVTATANSTADASATVETPAAASVDAATASVEQQPPAQAQELPSTETPAEGDKSADQPAVAGAPEAYQFAAPEGMAFDPAVLDAFTGAAKEANLTQDAAQKIVEKMAPAIAARQLEQVRAIQEQWTKDSEADKEFGGAKLKESLALAKTAIQTLGTPELSKLLDESGLSNHPEVIRLLWKAGQKITPDSTLVTGKPTGEGGPMNPASILYDNTKK